MAGGAPARHRGTNQLSMCIVLAVLAIVSAILLIIGGEFSVAVIIALVLAIVAIRMGYLTSVRVLPQPATSL
ncbi:hypothetical protein Y032_0777g2283 [Ancylostoma ceylanicum]|uniref:Uncharacterized protein n=1 Tax=Ancylostoma ceylanicum TaxID=53326 RepID=A0A016WDE2_9BILA|nr:hypothetical protein Y032_0777g2283 [Ancylostoma ceylanicum]